ncbi:beta-1,3-galactosyl-O-glycosyl-glycoprotein beta-1,6-N-acetylglucosaminyltransferase 4-like [Babylonia areolata]|uniref:beta-1,3-galactosyl-O-glycosyl-glycoprotein beta-1,6-N-acetylglucosaminyltransferase 4-like n=1 Tax=Babylonia areolata TaxID=304850 RepID=UPI003FD40A67
MTSSLTMTCVRHNRHLRVLAFVLVVIYCFWTFVVMNIFTLYSSKPSPEKTATSSKTVELKLNDSQLLLVPQKKNGSVWHQGSPQGAQGLVLRLRGWGLQGSRDRHEVTGEMMDVDMSLNVNSWRRLRSVLKETEKVLFPWKNPKVRRVDCRKLFLGDPVETEKARNFELGQTNGGMVSDKMVASLATSCPSLKKMFPFITSALTEEERDFPIAFSLLVFKDAEQVLRLLRTIYRPQNYYCVHVDVKSDEEFHRAMSAVVGCFPNVFLSSRSVDVQWAKFSVLEPEIICMEDLWRHKKWKYFINLTGQEFPLKTNYELVKILTAYRGANNLEGTRKRANTQRWKNRSPPPGGIIPNKGSVHIAVNRDFVDFVLHTTVGRQFQNWARHVLVPDEVFFTSLNHNPHLGIRGTYKGEPETHPTTYPFLTRFKNWGGFPFGFPCASEKRVRQICILSSGDLPLLDSRPELFANKFYSRRSRVALDCLAERIFNRTREQFLGDELDLNVSYYANMPFVKNMVETSTFQTVPVVKAQTEKIILFYRVFQNPRTSLCFVCQGV